MYTLANLVGPDTLSTLGFSVRFSSSSHLLIFPHTHYLIFNDKNSRKVEPEAYLTSYAIVCLNSVLAFRLLGEVHILTIKEAHEDM